MSTDQYLGVFGSEPARSYRSFPYSISGAVFVTGRYHFSKKFGISAALGLDNQTGDLSFGNPKTTSWGISGTTGLYKRKVYTIAFEASYSYYRKHNFETYGYIGAGYTSLRIDYNFRDNIAHQQYFYGTPSSMVPTNPYTADRSHVNFQVTPFGCRIGNEVAGYFELGVGYKGLVSAGISYRLQNGKRQKKTTRSEVLFLPKGYPLDSSCHYIGKERTSSPQFDPRSDFHSQIEALTESMNEKNANVFQVSYMNNVKYNNHYIIKGQIYYTSQFDSLKSNFFKGEKTKMEQDKCAYLTIYHTNYNQYLFPFTAKIKIDTGDNISITRNSKAVLKFTREGKYHVKGKHSRYHFDIDVKYGNHYYIHTHLKRTAIPYLFRSVIDKVDELQGSLESSLLEATDSLAQRPADIKRK